MNDFIIDPSKSGLRNLIDLIGRDNQKTLDEADYVFDKPQAIEEDESHRNTAVTVSASAKNPFSGEVVFKYRRLSLSDVVKTDLTHTVKPTNTVEEVLTEFATSNAIIQEELSLKSPIPDPAVVDHGDIVDMVFAFNNPESHAYLQSEIAVYYLFVKDPPIQASKGFPYTFPIQL